MTRQAVSGRQWAYEQWLRDIEHDYPGCEIKSTPWGCEVVVWTLDEERSTPHRTFMEREVYEFDYESDYDRPELVRY